MAGSDRHPRAVVNVADNIGHSVVGDWPRAHQADVSVFEHGVARNLTREAVDGVVSRVVVVRPGDVGGTEVIHINREEIEQVAVTSRGAAQTACTDLP